MRIGPWAEADRIGERLRYFLGQDLKRRGIVLGLSGGVDSSVTAALAARAGQGPGVRHSYPERHSESESRVLGKLVADSLGMLCIEENVSGIRVLPTLVY